MSKDGQKVSKSDWVDKLNENLVRTVFSLARGKFTEVHSFFGGIVAQEVVKYTGKFTPFNQLFLHEFYTGALKNR